MDSREWARYAMSLSGRQSPIIKVLWQAFSTMQLIYGERCPVKGQVQYRDITSLSHRAREYFPLFSTLIQNSFPLDSELYSEAP